MALREEWRQRVSQPEIRTRFVKDVYINDEGRREIGALTFTIPIHPGRYPALLAVSPYGKELQALLAPVRPYDYYHGAERCRGRKHGVLGLQRLCARDRRHARVGSLGGRILFLRPPESEDGYDLVEWIAGQPWCDGNVGMIACPISPSMQISYGRAEPASSEGHCPCEGLTDATGQSCYHGGILNYGFTCAGGLCWRSHRSSP